jgi:DNA-binding GntR family transcriptional regulator
MKIVSKNKMKSAAKLKDKINLTREAYNDIRRMIFINELRPGQKVAYRDMAKRLGMSLTPVVQALKHMEFLGLLQHEPNRGFYIKPIVAEEIEEAYELREVLEVNLIPKIVAQFDENAKNRLTRALEEYLAAGCSGSLKLRLSKDMNFHMTLAEISNQSISVWMLRYLLDFLYLRFEKEQIFSRPQASAAVEHQKIFDFIVAGDTRAAGKAMREHIRSVKKNVLKDIQSRMNESDDIEI